MATEARGRGISELHHRSRGMAFATPRSAAVVDGLATAAKNDASLNALLGQGRRTGRWLVCGCSPACTIWC